MSILKDLGVVPLLGQYLEAVKDREIEKLSPASPVTVNQGTPDRATYNPSEDESDGSLLPYIIGAVAVLGVIVFVIPTKQGG